MPVREGAEARSLQGQALSDEAFTHLASRHRRALVRYLYRRTRDFHLAEDLCQETLFRAFNALSALESPARIKSWLYSIAYHVSVDWIRNNSAHKRSPACALAAARSQRTEAAGSDELLIRQEDHTRRRQDVERLWGKVRELPPIYREVFEMRYRRWRPIAHIAKEVGIPEGNVKVRLFRARRKLLKILASHEDPGKWSYYGLTYTG